MKLEDSSLQHLLHLKVTESFLLVWGILVANQRSSALMDDLRVNTKNAGNFMLTQALFLELAHSEDHVAFTMKDEDVKGYKSFPTLYRELCQEDPTEYDLAIRVFGSWEHWVTMLKNPTIKKMVEKLREEISVYVKRQAMKTLLEDATGNSKSAPSSAKYLIEQPWVKKTPARKAKLANEGEKAFSSIREDAKRLGVIE